VRRNVTDEAVGALRKLGDAALLAKLRKAKGLLDEVLAEKSKPGETELSEEDMAELDKALSDEEE
jgi:hypothetical protein